MKYGIWCCVSGGRTGNREAWLKQADSILPATFDTFQEAQTIAQELTKKRAEHPWAVFGYYPRLL